MVIQQSPETEAGDTEFEIAKHAAPLAERNSSNFNSKSNLFLLFHLIVQALNIPLLNASNTPLRPHILDVPRSHSNAYLIQLLLDLRQQSWPNRGGDGSLLADNNITKSSNNFYD